MLIIIFTNASKPNQVLLRLKFKDSVEEWMIFTAYKEMILSRSSTTGSLRVILDDSVLYSISRQGNLLR